MVYATVYLHLALFEKKEHENDCVNIMVQCPERERVDYFKVLRC
jgi:hypothetical protein